MLSIRILLKYLQKSSIATIHERNWKYTSFRDFIHNNQSLRTFSNQSSNPEKMLLSEIVQKLEIFAPTKFAEKWDNVGILVEPTEAIDIKSILLTNDLSESVLKEAKEIKANLIISYHPPIFAGLKKLTRNTWKERIIVGCIENQIAIYSPHTSWDSKSPDGINDWLANSLPVASKSIALPNTEDFRFGAGRVCKVEGNLTLREAIERIKKYTGMPDVRVGIATSGSLDSQIKSFGVCAGSGASVLSAIKEPIELFITGELGHHEALDAIHRQVNVITLNHSNSERGYLKLFKPILEKLLDNKEILVKISESDSDPLITY